MDTFRAGILSRAIGNYLRIAIRLLSCKVGEPTLVFLHDGAPQVRLCPRSKWLTYPDCVVDQTPKYPSDQVIALEMYTSITTRDAGLV